MAGKRAAVPVEALQLVTAVALRQPARVLDGQPQGPSLPVRPLQCSQALIERAAVLMALAGLVDLVVVAPVRAGCRVLVLRPCGQQKRGSLEPRCSKEPLWNSEKGAGRLSRSIRDATQLSVCESPPSSSSAPGRRERKLQS